MFAISLAQRSKEDKSMSGTKDFHSTVPVLTPLLQLLHFDIAK
jgi:hypothetical protein